MSLPDAVNYMRREAAGLHGVVLGEAMTRATMELLEVAREVVGPRRVFIVDVKRAIKGQHLMNDDDPRVVTPEVLVEHYRGWIDAESSQ